MITSNSLRRRIADGVQRAFNNLRPAEMAFGTAEAPEHVFNRRWFMQPGTVPANPFGTTDLVKMNPPAGSPNLTEPAGPTDPTVSFLAFREPGGGPISVFSAYSLHYVGGVAARDISADYYGMYCERLERLLGGQEQDPPLVALMANGTSGDINNINFRQPRPSKKPYEQMRFVADDVAKKVHAALENLKYSDRISLAARYREPTLRWRHPTEEQLAWAKQTEAAGPKCSAAPISRISTPSEHCGSPSILRRQRFRSRRCGSATSASERCPAKCFARLVWSSNAAAPSSRRSWSS